MFMHFQDFPHLSIVAAGDALKLTTNNYSLTTIVFSFLLCYNIIKYSPEACVWKSATGSSRKKT